jgi:hypothetical protein
MNMTHSARWAGSSTTLKALLTTFFVGMLATHAAFGGGLFPEYRNSIVVHSETVLSGIDVRNNTIQQVIEKLGEPSRVTVKPRTGRDPTFETYEIYEWETKTCWIRLIALNESSMEPPIRSVDVWGTHRHAEIGTTGSGLKLGDLISDAGRIYGLRLYFGAALPNDRASWAAFQDYGAPSLTIDFDKDGRVNHMRLTNSLESY